MSANDDPENSGGGNGRTREDDRNTDASGDPGATPGSAEGDRETVETNLESADSESKPGE